MSAPNSSSAQSANKDKNMNITVGNKQPADPLTSMKQADGDKKKAADGPAGADAAKTGAKKIKDPNQAHETLDMPENAT